MLSPMKVRGICPSQAAMAWPPWSAQEQNDAGSGGSLCLKLPEHMRLSFNHDDAEPDEGEDMEWFRMEAMRTATKQADIREQAARRHLQKDASQDAQDSMQQSLNSRMQKMKADRAEEKGQKEAGRRMLEAMLTATNATYQKFGFPPLLSGSGKLPPRGLVPAGSLSAEPRPVGIPALPQPSPRNFLQMPCLTPRAAAVPGGPSLNIPVPRGMSNSAFTPRLPLTRCSSEPPPSLMPIVSAGPLPRPMRHDVSRERVSLPIRSASFQPAVLRRSFSSNSLRSVSYIPPSVVSTASPLHQGSFRALSGPQASPVMTPRAPSFRTLTSTSSWPTSSVTSPRLDAQQRSASPMQQVRTRSRALPSLGAAGLPLLSEAELPTVSRSLPGNTKTSGTPLSERLREMRKASPVKSMSMYETGFGSPLASYKPYSMQEMVPPMKSQSMFETSPQRTRGMIPIESSRNTTSYIKAVSTSSSIFDPASLFDPASASGNGEAVRLDVGNVISS